MFVWYFRLISYDFRRHGYFDAVVCTKSRRTTKDGHNSTFCTVVFVLLVALCRIKVTRPPGLHIFMFTWTRGSRYRSVRSVALRPVFPDLQRLHTAMSSEQILRQRFVHGCVIGHRHSLRHVFRQNLGRTRSVRMFTRRVGVASSGSGPETIVRSRAQQFISVALPVGFRRSRRVFVQYCGRCSPVQKVTVE